MRIVDLRPRTIRFMDSLWSKNRLQGRQKNKKHNSGWVADLAANVVDKIISRRVIGRGFPAQHPFILSVGNLALGGTGKTPVVAALASALAAANFKGCVLTRGYRSGLRGPVRVLADNLQAGDEARMLAGMLEITGWPVIQSRKRLAGLELINKSYSEADIIIVEDGHQTADLPRHLDIVILDRWRVIGDPEKEKLQAITGPVFPFGPYRESAVGAERAEIWLVETEESLPLEAETGADICPFKRSLTLSVPGGLGQKIVNGTETSFSIKNDIPWAALSGIAQPESFERQVTDILKRPACVTVRCEDHVVYKPDLVKMIVDETTAAGACVLVTTAKDWVKLAPCWRADLPVVVAELKISWTGQKTLSQLVEERLNI